MVTGEKPDEQVDWSEVERGAERATGSMHEFGRAVVRIGTPLSEAIDAVALRVFGYRVADLPSWLHELWALEAEHAGFGLRGRARRRLGALRKRERRRVELLRREAQRRAIGVVR